MRQIKSSFEPSKCTSILFVLHFPAKPTPKKKPKALVARPSPLRFTEGGGDCRDIATTDFANSHGFVCHREHPSSLLRRGRQILKLILNAKMRNCGLLLNFRLLNFGSRAMRRKQGFDTPKFTRHRQGENPLYSVAFLPYRREGSKICFTC